MFLLSSALFRLLRVCFYVSVWCVECSRVLRQFFQKFQNVKIQNFTSDWLHECMNEWMNEWMNEKKKWIRIACLHEWLCIDLQRLFVWIGFVPFKKHFVFIHLLQVYKLFVCLFIHSSHNKQSTISQRSIYQYKNECAASKLSRSIDSLR